MGITPQTLDSTLYGAFGQDQVSTMYTALNQYHVVMEVAPKYWQSPEGLNYVYLPTANSGQVPLSAVTHFEAGTAPIAVNHQGQFPSVTVSFNLAPGMALGDARDEINKMQQEAGLPASIRGDFSGTLQAFTASLSTEPWLIAIALVAVYIVLGVLYESYIHPITILSTLPSAGLGAVLALMFCHTDLSIIALIGIILLIGIVKKNAILMIDFALDAERREGKSSKDAIYQACLLRFRPILMTTMAAMLGAMPLVVGLGTGSELRRPLGIAIVGGLAVSQVLTLYTTPVVYLYLDRVAVWWRRLHGKPVRETVRGGWSKSMNRKFSIIAVSAAAFALWIGGCNLAPKYQKPSVETPGAFKEAAGWKPAQPKDDARRGHWWEVFGDPQLNALEEQVSVSNQNIAAAFANFLAARAVVKEARAAYYPVLTTSPSATRSYESGTPPPAATTVGTKLEHVPAAARRLVGAGPVGQYPEQRERDHLRGPGQRGHARRAAADHAGGPRRRLLSAPRAGHAHPGERRYGRRRSEEPGSAQGPVRRRHRFGRRRLAGRNAAENRPSAGHRPRDRRAPSWSTPSRS